MAKIESSTREDLIFDGDALTDWEDDGCWFVALDNWEIAIILSSLRYAHWLKRWRNLGGHTWDEIEAKISNLEYCLMAGCNVGELLEKFDTLNGYMSTLVGRLVTPGGENIAEIVNSLDLTCGDTTVNFDTEAIADAIIAQTTMQEERSIAEVTGQNTNFSDLVTAVNGLELSAICSPDVNVNCGSGGGGCLCDGGTIVPPEIDTGGEEPPNGMTDPPYIPGTPEFNERKCRWANLVYDDLLGILTKFYEGNVIGIISLTGGAAASAVIMAILLLFAVGAVAAALIGTVAGLIIALSGNIDLTKIIGIFTNYRTDLVCALYQGENGQDGLDRFMQVLTDNGAIEPELNLIQVIMSAMGWNLGYWAIVDNTTIEEQIMEHEMTLPCDTCATPGVFDFTVDEQGWLIDEANSTNGQYITDTTFRGITTGSVDGKLSIYYPELATITDLKAWIYGTLGQVTYIDVQTADSLEGPWTVEAYHEFVSTAGDFTMNEFTGLSITNKYVKIYLKRFWTDPEVDIQRVEWE